MESKRIIFIGGTAYSGSTMLDMMLSSSSNAMSLGEIYALFRPWRKHHFEKIAELKKEEKWKIILKQGENNLYDNIFKYFPEINVLVDSSKNPFWIWKQSRINRKYNIKNVLIWKSPIDLSYSFYKREELNNFKKSFINYYKSYCYLIKDYKKVNYSLIVNNNNYLKEISDYCDIDFNLNMLEFWRKEHQPFFGNNNTRRHVDSLDFEGKEKLSFFDSTTKRKLTHTSIPDNYNKDIYDKFKNDIEILNVSKFLEGDEITFPLKVSILNLTLRYITRFSKMRRMINRVRF